MYGGYSESIVVDQRFVMRVPSNLNLAAAASALRGNYDVLAHAPLESRERQEGWCRRTRWIGTHGSKVRARVRSPCGGFYNFSQQERRCTSI
jgi:D-arabinose 1-dehydrogenase-like Zn-dependent alcohol dehydrogenase